MCISDNAAMKCYPLNNGELFFVVFMGDQEIMREHYGQIENTFPVKYFVNHVKKFITDTQLSLSEEEQDKICTFLTDLYNLSWYKFPLCHAAILKKNDMVNLLQPGNAIYFTRPLRATGILSATNWSHISYNVSSWFMRTFLKQFLGLPGIIHCGIIVGTCGNDATIIHDPGYKQQNNITNIEFTTLNAQLGLNVENVEQFDDTRLMPFYCYKCCTNDVYSKRCRWLAVQTAYSAFSEPRIYNIITQNCENFAVYCCQDRRQHGDIQITNIVINLTRYIIFPVISTLLVSVGYYGRLLSPRLAVFASAAMTNLCFAFDHQYKDYFGKTARYLKLRSVNNDWMATMDQMLKTYVSEKNYNHYQRECIVLFVLSILKLQSIPLLPEEKRTTFWNVLSAEQRLQTIEMFMNSPKMTIFNRDGIKIRCRLIRAYRAHILMQDSGMVLTFSTVQVIIIFLYHSVWNLDDLCLMSFDRLMRPIWFDHVDILHEVYDLVDVLINATVYGYPGKEFLGFRIIELYPSLMYFKLLLTKQFNRLMGLAENKLNSCSKQEQQFLALIDLSTEKYLVQSRMFVYLNKLEECNKLRSKDDSNVSRIMHRQLLLHKGIPTIQEIQH